MDNIILVKGVGCDELTEYTTDVLKLLKTDKTGDLYMIREKNNYGNWKIVYNENIYVG